MDFSTGGNVIMDYRYILRGNGLKLKRLNDGFVFYKHTAFVISFRLPVDWSGVDYMWIIVMFYQLFGLILTAPIHCRASIAEQVMQCYISPNLMNKQTHPNLGWPEGEGISEKHK